MKARQHHLEAFEAAIERPFLVAGRGKGPLDMLWKCAVRAEACSARGEHYAGFVWDFANMIDYTGHARAIGRARELGMPEGIIRATIAAYQQARFVQLHGAVGTGIYAERGIVPGCAAATLWARVVVLQGLDDIASKHCIPRKVEFGVFIDDFTVTAAGGTRDGVCNRLAAIAQDLEQFICEDLKGAIAEHKAVVIANDATLAKQVRTALGDKGGRCGTRPVVLGVDFIAGRSRCEGRTGKRRERLNNTANRRRRYRIIARAAGSGRAQKLYTCGLRPAAAFGSEITGAAPAELKHMNQTAAIGLSPKARGRSLTAVRLLHGDPNADIAVAATRRYANAVWNATGHVRGAMSLGEIASAWENAIKGADKASWRTAKGPIAVATLELKRIGWEWSGPLGLRGDDGIVHSLVEQSPVAIAAALREGHIRHTARDMARRIVGDRASKELALYQPVINCIKRTKNQSNTKGMHQGDVCERSVDKCATAQRGIRRFPNLRALW